MQKQEQRKKLSKWEVIILVEIVFAKDNDEQELSEMMMEYSMGIPGEIEEQLIIRENNKVIAGGKIVRYEDNHFFLEVLGVKNSNKGKGYGTRLLKEFLNNPWNCCKNPGSSSGNANFQMTTLARGQAVGFYGKNGFVSCDFDQIPKPYRQQCIECPDRDECNPVPMIYFGG